MRISVEVAYQGRGLFGTIRGAFSRGAAGGAAWPTEAPRSPHRSPINGTRSEGPSARVDSLPRPKPLSQLYDVQTQPHAATAGTFTGRLAQESSWPLKCLNETRRASGHLAYVTREGHLTWCLCESREPLSHSGRRPSFHPRMDSLETPECASVPERGQRSPMIGGWYSPTPRRSVDTTAYRQFGSDERTGRGHLPTLNRRSR